MLLVSSIIHVTQLGHLKIFVFVPFLHVCDMHAKAIYLTLPDMFSTFPFEACTSAAHNNTAFVGKELQRMKALNVLGKVSPNASSKQTPVQRQLQK